MGAITEIFRTFGPEYLARYPDMPLQHKKPSLPSSTAVPGNTALPYINAIVAAKNIISTAPAATATARNASITKAASGWKHSLSDDCPATTF